MIAGQYYYTKYVRNYRMSITKRVEEKDLDDEEETTKNEMKQKLIEGHGKRFYGSLHFILYTGFFRMLPSKEFPFEMGVAYSLELFL